MMSSNLPDITISLPIYIRVGKGANGRFSLNLNTYRNAHFHKLNQAKILFEKIVAGRVKHLPVMIKTDLTYSLFFGSKRAIDISNICCIVDKFFCDTLINQKKLIDDNMNSISEVAYRWGGVDRHDPRIEVILSNIQPVEEENTMQIILTQQEIEDLVRDAVLQQITIREDQGISITFQGIVESRFVASVTIHKIDEEAAPRKVRTRRIREDKTDEVAQEEPAKAHIVTEELATTPTKPIFAQPEPTPVKPATSSPTAVSKIFSAVETSAPATETVTPPKGKSLFANLTKPLHDAAKEQ